MYFVNPRIDRVFWFLSFTVMSAYILYEHATDCQAVDLETMIDRHRNLIAGNSEFYNPWQYRILAPFLLEGLIQGFHAILPAKLEILPYLFFRFLQNMAVFYVAYYYYKALKISNPVILFMGMMLLCYAVSNSVFQSDLSFNTYFDVIFYLLAGLVILSRKWYWIIPITLFAALNRETSGFIPLMVIAAAMTERGFNELPRSTWLIVGASLLLFAVVFIGVRAVYGYPQAEGIHGMTSPLDYLSFNLRFFRMYPELFGTLGLVPIIVILRFKDVPPILKNWFWLIVPFWFLIHLVKSTAIETRLFIVPMALIFVPAMLCLADIFYHKARRLNHPSVLKTDSTR